jgi:HKD family nuclease
MADSLKLITNSAAFDHKTELKKCFCASDKTLVFVAYLSKPGLDEIKGAIKKNLLNGSSFEFFVGGLDQFVTDPQALRALYRLLPAKSKPKRLYLAEQDHRCFHPKLYCLLGAATATVLIGSANLTGGGLKRNCEASVKIQVPLSHSLVGEILEFRKKVLGSSTEASETLISQYERRFLIADRMLKAARKKVKEQIKGEIHLNLRELDRLLLEYRRHPEGERKFAGRVRDYREAKEILDELCDIPIRSKADFVLRYGRLVGYAGDRPTRLWWSLGMQRSRSSVDAGYKDVVQMIRSIRENLHRSAEDVFRIGMQGCEKVKGLGVNVMTEVMNTYAPKRLAVLNKNPLDGLVDKLGCARFRQPNDFRPEDYANFNAIVDELREHNGFETMAQADHFLTFLYWKESRDNSSQTAKG